ncbi:Imm43 family immunity protein [Vibrio ostreae]|uniref:Immunity protein 43 domain-containing protein n=1 Tax=Vibrio ostreae TaxID=2841925 RepID=A0A975YM35_9VIBR|nr:hypothetical protein [Vibrio ostreae]QXO16292.1 hypothetical protein KNV97_01900 [Vibrio ostreae]
MNGKFTGETLIYLVFKRPINNDTDEIKKRYRFIDLNKTDWQYGKRNQIVPTGNVVLNENAFDYDILELSEFSVVHSQIVISEKVKLSIEKHAVKGVKLIGLNKGINEHLVDNHIEISRYLPKAKKKSLNNFLIHKC